MAGATLVAEIFYCVDPLFCFANGAGATIAFMPSLHSLWNAATGQRGQADFQPTQGNRRRVEIYDGLIHLAQLRAEAAGTVADRRACLQLIVRLDARCKREVRRREDQTRP